MTRAASAFAPPGSGIRPNIRLRDAQAAETPLLTLIVRESGVYAEPHRAGVANPVDPRVDRATVPFRTRIAVANGQISGFSRLQLPNEAACGDAELDYLFVHERWRRDGIGRALFTDMTELAASLCLEGIRIVAHPPAEPFFRRLGAERVGTQAPRGRITWSRPVLYFAVHTPLRRTPCRRVRA